MLLGIFNLALVAAAFGLYMSIVIKDGIPLVATPVQKSLAPGELPGGVISKLTAWAGSPNEAARPVSGKAVAYVLAAVVAFVAVLVICLLSIDALGAASYFWFMLGGVALALLGVQPFRSKYRARNIRPRIVPCTALLAVGTGAFCAAALYRAYLLL